MSTGKTAVMPEEIFDRDLSDATLWGVNLRGATFRDADLSGATFFHTAWTNVSIDGVIDRMVVNGVDVTEYVNAHDRWYPLRNQLEPTTAAGVLSAWRAIESEWVALCDRVQAESSLADVSVNGEWTLRQTMRHLLFAMDKWFSFPFLGATTFTACGLPNTGSQGREWPGLDPDADPTFDEVLGICAVQSDRFANFLETTNFDDLPETVEILENGEMPTVMCFHAVLEEEFEHLRYVLRDLEPLMQ
jgi:hypothetical protein